MIGLSFGLIGDGTAAKRHRSAIKEIGGVVKWARDPKYANGYIGDIEAKVDYVVICSPTHLHMEHIRQAGRNQQIIVEKPICLPWEQIPVDWNNVSVVLQLRWLPLKLAAKEVRVKMVRDDVYFRTWKGDPRKTGGLFYNLFIHYIDLANVHGADFIGVVADFGEQHRLVEEENMTIDLDRFNMDSCYAAMYCDIVQGKGVRPRDLQFLHWQLTRNSEMYGYGRECINKVIEIKNEIG